MIQRQLHIYCDSCKAEGPYIVGEKRPALLQDVVRLGWKLSDDNKHVCMECEKTSAVIKQDIEAAAAEYKLLTEADVTPDRSTHWTEARKKGDQ